MGTWYWRVLGAKWRRSRCSRVSAYDPKGWFALNRTRASAVIFFESIAPIFKFAKIAADAWVIDRLAASIFFEIGLGNISAQASAIVD